MGTGDTLQSVALVQHVGSLSFVAHVPVQVASDRVGTAEFAEIDWMD